MLSHSSRSRYKSSAVALSGIELSGGALPTPAVPPNPPWKKGGQQDSGGE
ncbi:MAG: hypothetical protein AAGH67_12665 [Cyanobacteria bacterium P01_H01_bin.162]